MKIVSATSTPYYTIEVMESPYRIKWKNRWLVAKFYREQDAKEKMEELLAEDKTKYVTIIKHYPTSYIVVGDKR